MSLPTPQAERVAESKSPRVSPPVLVRPPAVTAPATDLQLRAADHVVEYLVTVERVDTFFALPGGAISPVDDAVNARMGVRVISVRHEADAVFAAAGYARLTGKLGVALVTSGPGVLNAINALASANLEGLPVLVLAGDSALPQRARGSLQDGGIHGLDILHLARSVTKACTELVAPTAALAQLAQVIATMRHGRPGAGLVTCPVDVARARGPVTKIAMSEALPPMVDEDSLDRAAAMLARASRPLLFAGNGARTGAGPEALRRLAERLQAPVITTPHGKGVFPESHPLALGVYGLALHDSAVAFLERGFDCMLAVGTGFSELATNGWSPLLKPRGASASMIQIDIDPARIGRVYPVELAIVGDAAVALDGLRSRLPQRPRRFYGVEAKTDPAASPLGPEGKITPQRALWELQQAMPRGARYTVDSGEHTLYALHYLSIDDPAAFTAPLGLASMGAGIGAALGIAAAGDAPVAAIAGDGGFLMSLSAVGTAAHARLPIVFAIIDDGRYGMCDIGYQAVYGRSPGFATGPVDLLQIAAGLGCRSALIEQPGEILSLDLAAMTANGPVVLDIRIDREVRMFPNVRHEVIQTRAEPDRRN